MEELKCMNVNIQDNPHLSILPEQLALSSAVGLYNSQLEYL